MRPSSTVLAIGIVGCSSYGAFNRDVAERTCDYVEECAPTALDADYPGGADECVSSLLELLDSLAEDKKAEGCSFSKSAADEWLESHPVYVRCSSTEEAGDAEYLATLLFVSVSFDAWECPDQAIQVP